MANSVPDGSGSEPTVSLRHGTTRMRAEHLLQHGPDPHLIVGGDTANGFSTVPEHGPYLLGTAEDYASGKARLFPHEGGPAILEVDVPQSLAVLAVHPGGEVWFGPGFGWEELLAAWPLLSKRIVTP